MGIEHLLISMVILFAFVIVLSLAITHHHIKLIYRGIDYLAIGIVCHVFGFAIYSGTLIDIGWLSFFVGNGLIIIGTLILHKGITKFVGSQQNYKRVYIIVVVTALLGMILYFSNLADMFYQNLMSLLVIYMIVEIMLTVLKADNNIKKSLSIPMKVFGVFFLILMIARVIIVQRGMILEPIINETLTYQVLICIIGGLLFVILGFTMSIVINVRAITDLKIERARLEQISITDHLTGLPNRLGLEKYIQSIQNKTEKYAVMFADFDEFKKVNDHYGHMIGDKVIIEFSRLLLQMNDEHMFTARYGGDEFVTIVTKFENEKTLKASIENKIKSIGSQIKVQNYTFDLTISVGVAIYPIHGQDIYSLIGKADSALGQIKLNGKNNIRFYQ